MLKRYYIRLCGSDYKNTNNFTELKKMSLLFQTFHQQIRKQKKRMLLEVNIKLSKLRKSEVMERNSTLEKFTLNCFEKSNFL